MAFKKLRPAVQVPDSPEKLFRLLPRRNIPDVMPHQKDIMSAYASQHVDTPDIALQLPTGSGKTLVGLLIAEWRRRKYAERIVYLCPTRQLVNQVVEQAEEKYGLTVLGFIGSAQEYDQTAKANYRTADSIAITTYSSLFNTHPFFSDTDVLILDDAHATENYISTLWSLRVERNNHAHRVLHTALLGVIQPLLEQGDFVRVSGQENNLTDFAWVDKIPTPEFVKIAGEITAILDEHVHGTDLSYPWSMIRGNLHSCHLYLSSQEILIRPLIPPTWTHAPFSNPRQRIYMSATLGNGGDLERLMGRRSIQRLAIPKGWDRQGVGRRFFIFPNMSLDVKTTTELRQELMRQAKRSLVLVPTEQMCDKIAKDVEDNLRFSSYRAGDIEDSKKLFISEPKAVAVVANRYDGIDFPGDECRLLFIDGLPKATNLQERFIMTRMGANVLFNERIQVRVLQAIGRCTRSLEDYSAVVVSGEELTDYLADKRRRKFLHPELQSEIAFGVEQSRDVSLQDFIENFETFLKNGKDWEEVNQQIVVTRENTAQANFPAIEELSSIVADEVEFQKQLWQGDYETALESAGHVLEKLNESELRGYRALWHYLAGSVARLGSNAGTPNLAAKAQTHFSEAKKAAIGIRWMVKLAHHQDENNSSVEDDRVLMEQIERVEEILAKLGIVQEQKFAKREKEILEGLQSTERGPFEHAHKLLGELLGFESGNVEADGSPDSWWLAGSICFVFEDHAGAEKTSALDVKKARQVSSHPNWMRKKIKSSETADILSVLVTPVEKVKQDATVHLDGVALWPLDKFRAWAADAIAIIRKLRMTFIEPGDLKWRATAAREFKQGGLDASRLKAKLQSQSVATTLKSVR